MSMHGNVLTAQTSSTGDVTTAATRLMGFTVSVNTTNANATLSLRNTTAGSTLGHWEFAPAIRNDTVILPGDGMYFPAGITVSSMAELRSVTLYHQ